MNDTAAPRLARRDARALLVALGVALVTVLSEPPGALAAFPAYALLAALAAWGLGASPRKLARALLSASPFLLGAALWLGGARALSSEWEPGLRLGASIALRGGLAVLLVASLTAALTLGGLVLALRRLGLPPALGLVMTLAARYVHLLREELARTSRARRARTVRDVPLAAYGAQAGTLLLRAWRRADGVERAMRARGFDGARPLPPAPRLTAADFLLPLASAALFLPPRLWL